MRKLVMVGVVAGAAALGALVPGRSPTGAQQKPTPADSLAAPRLTPADSARLKGPRQPIFFRHDLHAGQFKMQCQYCHYSVGAATEPGIPSVQTCMACHTVIAGADSTNKAEIRKLRQYWSDRDDPAKPKLEWTRIHTLARHAHFPHMRHIKALGASGCQTCHGDVARMPRVFKVNNVNNMGFCISCHVARGVTRDCTTCHY
jgi:hypothetical protein